MREITFGEAVKEAIREGMRQDETIYLCGEDVAGGIWNTGGLVNEFGTDRIIDTPISEAAIVGSAIGAARTGLRPIVELMFDDLLTIACEQIINQAARMRYMFGEIDTSLPLIILAPGGTPGGGAGHHSSLLIDWFMHIPGLKLVVPSTPYDAKGLMKACLTTRDPIIFSEHKRLFGTKGPVSEEDYNIPLGEADIKKEGNDVTIVAMSLMVHEALKAADDLEREGISAEIVDPRTLKPLDKQTIIKSVKKTGRLVTVQESWGIGGFGAEIAGIIADEAFDYLDAPIKRIGAKDVPIPFSPPLERYVIPHKDDISKTIKSIL